MDGEHAFALLAGITALVAAGDDGARAGLGKPVLAAGPGLSEGCPTSFGAWGLVRTSVTPAAAGMTDFSSGRFGAVSTGAVSTGAVKRSITGLFSALATSTSTRCERPAILAAAPNMKSRSRSDS